MKSLKGQLIWASKVYLIIVGLTLSAFLSAGFAQAAPLTFNSDFTVNLSSPSASLTIKSGSIIDSLVVNAGNIVVTISTTSGETFTMTSYPQIYTSAASGSGTGSVSQSCNSGGTQTTTITQSTASSSYTLAPTNNGCPSVSGNGGPGSVGSNTYIAASPTLSVSPSPTPLVSVSPIASPAPLLSPLPSVSVAPSVAAQIEALKAQLAQLIAQAIKLGLPVSPEAQQLVSPSITINAAQFNHNLSFGSKGADVKALQLLLISKNSGPAAQALAKVGATGRFLSLTRKALAEFQEAVGIHPASGFFGPKTRAYINSLGQ